MNNGTVAPFDGDLEDYRSIIVQSSRKKDEKQQTAAEEAVSKSDQRKANAEKRASLAPLKKRINEAEAQTAKLEKLIAALDVELADPALYEKSPAKAAEKAKQRSDAATNYPNWKNCGWSFPLNTKKHSTLELLPRVNLTM